MLHKLFLDKKIILASGSPRRVEILKQVGLTFQQMAIEVDEGINAGEDTDPAGYVLRVACAKNRRCVESLPDDDFCVISADTTVYLNKEILGKPRNIEECKQFLKKLSGQLHTVYTGIAISYKAKEYTGIEKSLVKFCELSLEEIQDYISTGEAYDKAGGYGVQGYGAQFIEKIEGCYFNVMGFPIGLFYRMIKNIGI